MADRIGERTSQGAARGSRGGRDDQANGRSRRFGLGRLAEQEDRPSRQLRTSMQTPGGCQVELARIAIYFEKNSGEFAQPGSLFGNPERIG
jgi:hypothetical protein